METTKSTADGAVTLTVSGKLSAAAAEAFGVAINDALPEVVRSFTLDFAGVDYLASAGLRVLVTAHKKLREKKVRVRIINVCPAVKEVFELVGLDSVFDLADAGSA
jgi:anti-anti-sigma factor